MLSVVRARKAERLEKVVVLARERKVITNDDVQKMLTVSNATATNYLRELVRTGRLTKTGVRAGTRYHAM
jgi:Fic family protein